MDDQTAWLIVMADLNQALAFSTMVHDAQKREGLWLAQHPFVQAVRSGLARRDEIKRWVRQVFCTTRTYIEILESVNPQTATEPPLNARRDLRLLIQLGEALGVSEHVMAASEPYAAARSVEAWMRQHLAASKDSGGQICWALVEAMSPETGDFLAEGFERHFEVRGEQIRYLTLGMKSNLGVDQYAAEKLINMPMDEWDSLQKQTLLLSRLLVQLYNSVGDMWSAW